MEPDLLAPGSNRCCDPDAEPGVKREESFRAKTPRRSLLSRLSHVSVPWWSFVLAGYALIGVWPCAGTGNRKTSERLGIELRCPKWGARHHYAPPTTQPVAVRPEPVKPPPPAPAVKIGKFKAIYMRRGRQAPAEVKNGDTLTAEDRYYVVFSPMRSHVYMAQVDSADMITPIFPNRQFSAKSNPLRPEAEHRFPERNIFPWRWSGQRALVRYRVSRPT